MAAAFNPLAPATAAQALLLQAATGPAAGAVAAWRAWQRAATVDDLEPDAQWLLPLLDCHLRAAGVDSAALARYASVYRHNWYKNHLRLRALGPTLAALWRAGHAPVLVGGAALAAAYYPALGARPFNRAALHVPGLTVEAARAAWPQVRWQAWPPVARTRTVAWPGGALTVPEPAEALVQALAGVGQDDDPSALLWAADAAVLGRRLDAAGWAAVWRRAAELGLTKTVQARLGWLGAAGVLLEPQPA